MSEQAAITPTLEEFVKLAIDARMIGVHVGMPAKVLSYDPSSMMCQVQPLLKKKYTDGTLVNLPVINNVPVGQLRAGEAVIHMPLDAGHTVYLHFSERSIDNWKKAGGLQDPADARKHDLSDAVAYPGFYSFADKIEIPNPKAITVLNKNARLEVLADGRFKLANDSQELLDLMTQLVQAILDARVNTIFGPQPVINLLTFEQILLNLETLKG